MPTATRDVSRPTDYTRSRNWQCIFKTHGGDYCREPVPAAHTTDIAHARAWANAWCILLERRNPGAVFTYSIECWV